MSLEKKNRPKPNQKKKKKKKDQKTDQKDKKQPFSGLTNTKKSPSCQIVTSPHIHKFPQKSLSLHDTSPNAGKKTFPHGKNFSAWSKEEEGGGEKMPPSSPYRPPPL